MIRGVRSSTPASDEFAAAVHWYEKQRPGLGGEFFRAVTEGTDRIEAHPEIGTALGAGREILEVYATDFGVEHKDGASPLTLADRRAHRAIEEGLGPSGLPVAPRRDGPLRIVASRSPVVPQAADRVREKLAEVGIGPEDIDAAVRWARRS